MVGGFLFVPRKPKNDLLLREIQEAMKDMSMEGQVSSGEVTLVDDQNQNQEKVVGRKVLM
jgi:hypothetical protein